MNWSLTMENSRDSHNSKIHRGQFRRIFNLALFNRLPAFWEGTEITEEGDNYICIAPRVVKDQQQGYFPGIGKKWPQHIWWRFRGSENPLKAQKKAFDNVRPGGLYRLPSIACPSLRFSTVLIRYFTPIDADSVRMFSFALKRVTRKNPLVKLVVEYLLQLLVGLFQLARSPSTRRKTCRCKPWAPSTQPHRRSSGPPTPPSSSGAGACRSSRAMPSGCGARAPLRLLPLP